MASLRVAVTSLAGLDVERLEQRVVGIDEGDAGGGEVGDRAVEAGDGVGGVEQVAVVGVGEASQRLQRVDVVLLGSGEQGERYASRCSSRTLAGSLPRVRRAAHRLVVPLPPLGVTSARAESGAGSTRRTGVP